MVFSSLLFTFLFFILCMSVYLLIVRTKGSASAGNVVLLVASLIFYAFGGPLLIFLLSGMTLICWGGALLLHRQQTVGRKKAVLAGTLVLSLGLLGYFKYANLLVTTAQFIFGQPISSPGIVLPIGISFYTFQLLSYVIDVYRGSVEPQKKYWLLLLYSSLFHQCIAGPIVRYHDIEQEILDRKISLPEVSRGITRFTVGLAKKAVLANYCAGLVKTLLPAEMQAVQTSSSVAVFLGGLYYMLQIYLDFSAYSDMAIGMGLMAGFHYPENFNYPYTATSVTDFWRRWHMSLGSFFRDYVYIPLGGNRVSVPRHIFNLFVVWALTGIWHGASWNYLLWGLYFFIFLVLEKYLFRFSSEPDAFAAVLRRIYTLAVVFLGWFLFRFEDMSMLLPALAGLFGAAGTSSAAAWLTLRNNLIFTTVAIAACAPTVPKIRGLLLGLGEKNRAVNVLCQVLSVSIPVILLFLSLISLVGDTYNPFMYTRF
ncbi:MAG: MBOAT family protein [Clostridia bacterium]|nr:MBOAT family protein [Clostridia bacterium]